MKSQLKRLARPMYSNPPIHGARIVANVVGDPALFNEWKAEMEMMAGRIKGVRQKLYDSLSAKDKSGKDWSFILKQIGMFSFTGLNKAQVILSISSIPKLYHLPLCYSQCLPFLHASVLFCWYILLSISSYFSSTTISMVFLENFSIQQTFYAIIEVSESVSIFMYKILL